MRDAIFNTLASDAILTTILDGGIYTRTQISRQNTPAAFDDRKELCPVALLKFETLTSTPAVVTGGLRHVRRLFFCVYLYERFGHQQNPPRPYWGYSQIEQARNRIYDLLHRQYLRPENVLPVGVSPAKKGETSTAHPDAYAPRDCAWYITHNNDVMDYRDEALDAMMAKTCYDVYLNENCECC